MFFVQFCPVVMFACVGFYFCHTWVSLELQNLDLSEIPDSMGCIKVTLVSVCEGGISHVTCEQIPENTFKGINIKEVSVVN